LWPRRVGWLANPQRPHSQLGSHAPSGPSGSGVERAGALKLLMDAGGPEVRGGTAVLQRFSGLNGPGRG
jgi:hypothetical protein